MDPVKKDLRPLAIGLAVAAAACLLFGAFTSQWLARASRSGEIGFGLRSYQECVTWSKETQCKRQSNAELIEQLRKAGPEAKKQASSAFVPMGWVTFVGILIAALALLACAGLAGARKQLELPVSPASIALLGLMVILITGCVFVATKPGPPGLVGVGLSFWVFGIGCVMGIAAAQMIAKLIRPPDPDLTVD
jgi:hypothetical protein